MRRRNWWLRRIIAVLLLLAALAGAAVSIGLWMAERRALRGVDLPTVQAVLLPSDSSALERGRYLFESRGCAECHGADGGGRTFAKEGDSLELAAPNITKVSGGVVGFYKPVDWVRTIRHGVKPDDQPLRVMPSEDYNRMTDADLGALIAYVQSLPPRPARSAVIRFPLPARVMYGFGAIPDAADRIDHTLAPQQPVAEAVSVEHGAYVANLCLGCHGTKLEGGPIVGAPPDWPPAARLAPGEGNVMAARYAAADVFLKMLKTGQRPEGGRIAVMPFETLAKLSDTDARALHLYLTSLKR
jgi:mono/diheme cytochrome c family protein